MASVYEEIQKRAEVVQRAHPDWSEVDCETDVLHDPELYRRYVQESSSPLEPPVPSPRRTEGLTGAQAEVMRRAETMVTKSVGLSLNDAVAKVLHDDSALYWHYAKGDSMPAPTFGSELLSSQMDEFYDMTGALLRTMAGILDSTADDKGSRIAGALGEFTAAVRGKLHAAGLSVPTSTEKRASQVGQFIPEALQAEVLKTAGYLCREDYRQGLQYLTNTLREIRGAA